MTKPLRRLCAVIVSMTIIMLAGSAAAGAATAQPTATDPTTVPVNGTLADGTGEVDGTFDVQRFVSRDGTLTAVGTFTGTITNASGEVLANGTEQVALPVDVAASNGTCEILDLVLGPLNLDLLGLQVDLDTVHLNITAEQGPGNLLGNLLCAVAGLLDGGTGLQAILDQIAALLNQLLGLLE